MASEGARACWDIVEEVDRPTVELMAGRGFLVWRFDGDGEILQGL